LRAELSQRRFSTLSIAALLALRSRRSLRLCYIAGRRLPWHSDNLKTDGQLAHQSPLAMGKTMLDLAMLALVAISFAFAAAYARFCSGLIAPGTGRDVHT
jgi:hypothetical protein